LLNKIYNQNVILENGKHQELHKKGKKNLIYNHRPISNLCAGSKVFERLILMQILEIEELGGSRQQSARV
jgi:hypothetical protein